MVYDVVILGAGPAGLTAGLYAGRSRLSTLIIEKMTSGGQIGNTEMIENYPGFPEGISGPELARMLEDQALKFGVEFFPAEVTGVELNGPEKIIETSEETFKGKTVIIATGSAARKLNVDGESRLVGRGVSYCATCDGAFFRDKHVIVVGGGDAAIEEGLYLTKFAKQVTVVHRRNQLRATKILQDKAFANEKMQFIWDSTVDAILGDNKVEKVALKNLKTGEVSEVEAHGVFVYVGNSPATGFLEDKIRLNPEGYVITNELMETDVPGVFAAGDVRDKFLRQVVTAVADGAIAAMAAERYLSQ